MFYRCFKCFVILILVFFNYLFAADITVSQVNDANANTGGTYSSPTMCDLRGALNYINSQPSSGSYDINFDLTTNIITLQGPLPPINLNSAAINTVNINGMNTGHPQSIIVEGSGVFLKRGGFFIANSDANHPVTIQNLTIQNAKAYGGDGGSGKSGGGGGMGAGGAIFVDSQGVPNVVLKNLTINTCEAIGGDGASSVGSYKAGGGGGGLGGNGGSAAGIQDYASGAGGGGLIGAGGGCSSDTRGAAGGGGVGDGGSTTLGSAMVGDSGAGGGGGAWPATGGTHGAVNPSNTGTGIILTVDGDKLFLGGGGGGSGAWVNPNYSGDGGAKDQEIVDGAVGGQAAGGNSSAAGGGGGGRTSQGAANGGPGVNNGAGGNGGNGGLFGGGGGSGTNAAGAGGVAAGVPGNGGIGGGGGGAGISGFLAYAGGSGGYGGGGGGGGSCGVLSDIGPGGIGGFGGGGGGSGIYRNNPDMKNGGQGGFGGGGGGGRQGGSGGYGGGGGGGNVSGGDGIYGGGLGDGTGNGGGGVGFGGAIFFNTTSGGNFYLSNSYFTTGSGGSANSVTAGSSGGGSATAGVSRGADLFFATDALTSTSVYLNPSVGKTMTISGSLADDSVAVNGISKAGINLGIGIPSASSGTVILGAVNTYIKGTTTIYAGATLQINTVNAISGLTVGNVTNNGLLIINLASSDQSYPVTGVIAGPGNLTKQGAYKLTQTTSNTYTGITTMSAGTLSVSTINNGGAAGNLGQATNAAANIVFDGGTLQYTGNSAGTDRAFTIVAGKTATLDITANSLTISGNIPATTGALTKTGSGTLAIAGTNSYSGVTTLSAGTIYLFNNSGLGSGNLTMSTGTTLALASGFGVSNAVTLAGTCTVNVASGVGTLSGAIGGSGSLVKTGNDSLSIGNADTDYSGGTTLSAGVIGLTNSFGLGTGTLAMSHGTYLYLGSGINAGNPVTLAGTCTVNVGSGTGTLSGAISGTGTLAKTGAGILSLGNVGTTYSGGTTLSAGTIFLTNNSGLGSGTLAMATSGTTLALGSGINCGNPITLTGGNIFNVASGTGTLSGAISNAAISKTGSGVLILSGNNSYTGSTTVSAGTLRAGSTSAFGSNSPVAMANIAGAVLDLNNLSNTIGSLSGGGAIGGDITLGSATLTVDALGSYTQYDGVISGIGGSIAKVGGGELTLSGTNSYSGGTTLSAGKILLFNNSGLGSGTLAMLNGTILILGSAVNAGNAVTLAGTDTINVASGTGTLSGAIGSSGALSKIGSGVLILSGNNSYSGTTTVSVGTLRAGSTSAFGSNSAVVMANVAGVALDLNNFSNTIGSLSGGGAAGGNVTLGSATLTTNGNGSSTQYDGVISGINGSITKTGAGVLTLGGSNSYTGTTTVSAGTLRAGSTSAFGSNSAVVMANIAGAALDLNNLSNTIGSLSGGGAAGGNVTLGSATLTTNGNGSSTQHDGVISGINGSITKTGAGVLTLGGNNTYTGITKMSAGTLSVSAINNGGVAGNLGQATNAAENIVFDGGTLRYTGNNAGTNRAFTIALAKTAALDIAANTLTISGNVPATTGGLTKTGAGTLTLSGTNAYTGVSTMMAGTLSVSVINDGGVAGNLGQAASAAGNIIFDGGTLQYTGNTAGTDRAFTIIAAKTAALDITANTLTISGSIPATTGALTKTGSGTLILSGTNAYTGTTAVSAGILRAGSLSAFGSNSAVVMADVLGATLDLSNFSNTIGSLSGGGAAGGNVTLSSATLTTNGNGSSTQYDGVISGTGGSITKTGTGTLTLLGANNYTGGTTVSAGNLQGNTTSLQGNIINNALVVFDQAVDGTYSGVMTDAGSLTKQGAGVLTLSNSVSQNTTSVSAGTLKVMNVLTSPTVNVNAAGTLKGTGIINGPANVTVYGTMAPGTSIGTTTIVGDYTQAAGSTFECEVSPTASDRLIVTGNVTIEPGATIQIIPEVGLYPPNLEYVVISATGSLNGTFSTVTISPVLFTARAAYPSFTEEAWIVLNLAPLDSVITKGNAGKIARFFDYSLLPPDTDFEEIVEELVFLNTIDEIYDALDQMQPSALKSLPLTQEDASLLVGDAVKERQKAFYRILSCCGNNNKLWNAWTMPIFSRIKQSNSGYNVGYSSGIVGEVFGLDHHFSENTHIGLAAAYTRGSITMKKNRGKGHINSYYLIPYVSITSPHFYLNMLANGYYTQYENKRHIQFASIYRNAYSNPKGLGIQGNINACFVFEPYNAVIIRPFAEFDVVWQHEKKFTENNANGINLFVNSSNYLLLYGEAGLGLGKCFQSSNYNVSMFPQIDISYVCEDQKIGKHYESWFEVSGNSFVVDGLMPKRLLLKGGAEISFECKKQSLNFSLRYDCKFNKHYSNHAGLASLGYSF